jgi:hypothetical protein
MESKEFGELADATDQIVSLVAGFKAKMVEAGFSERIAEASSLEFMKMLMAGASSLKQ